MMTCVKYGDGAEGKLPTINVDPPWTSVAHFSTVGPSAGDTSKVQEDKDTWRNILLDFCQNTSIHALRQMTEPTPFAARRVLWAVVLVVGLALFLSQTVSSTRRYLRREVAVDMKLICNESLRFPAVTLCNQNAFRATRLAELGLYGAVSQLFSHGAHIDPNTEATRELPPRLTMEHLLNSSAHHKEALVDSCWWRGRRCRPEDFVTTLTDSGMCYTFNSEPGPNVKTVIGAGAEQGLRLRLNVEQYEYTRGPHPGAGVRLLLHLPGENPPPARHGYTLPPGLHALVGLKATQVHSLKSPYGQCEDDKPLKFHKAYTKSNCMADCLQGFLLRRCRCRDFYMPTLHPKLSNPRACTIVEYVTCVVPALRLFNRISVGCHCPLDCTQTIFDPTITFGVNSNFDLQKTLQGNTNKLQQSYTHAREVAHRIDNSIVESDKQLMVALQTAIDHVESSCHELNDQMITGLNSITSAMKKIRAVTDFHINRVLWGVKQQIKHNFIRGWKAISESTLDQVTLGFSEVGRTLKRVVNGTGIKKYQMGSLNREQLRLFLVQEQLENKMELIQEARRNLILVNRSYVRGEGMSDYGPFSVPVYDNSLIPSRILRNKAMQQHANFRDAIKQTAIMEKSIVKLLELMDIFYRNRSKMNFGEVLYDYDASCKRFNRQKYLISDRVIFSPLQIINKRIDKVAHLNDSIYHIYNEVTHTAIQLSDIVNITNMGFWQNIREITDMYKLYTHNKTMLKSDLYSTSIAGSMEESIDNVTRFFNSVRVYGAEFRAGLLHLHHSYRDLNQQLHQETTSQPLYSIIHEQLEELLNDRNTTSNYIPLFEKLTGRNFGKPPDITQVVSIMNRTIPGNGVTQMTQHFDLLSEQYLSDSGVIASIGLAELDFGKAVSSLKKSLQEFHTGNQLDTTFYRENFMSLDIFFKELCYNEISQQVAYDVNNLWGDVGGSAGLFVGASVITVFELLDVFIHNAFRLSLKKST